MASDEKPPLRGWVDFPQYTRHRIPMFMVREELARHGLHVVTAAEKEVLDACHDAVIVESCRGKAVHLLSDGSSELVARAELARRDGISPVQAEALSWRLDAEHRVLQACTDAGKENLEFIVKAGSGPVVAIARATLELLDARKDFNNAP